MNVTSRGRPDFLLLLVTLLLVGFGLVMVFSASSALAIYKHNNMWFFISKQGSFAFVGLFLMLIFMEIPYHKWKKSAPYLLLLSLLLLVMVLLVGVNINGARRWFTLGGFNLQPSEFTKLAVIFYLATLINKKGDRIRNFKKGLLPILLVVGFILFLVLMQPDFGTVLILFFIAGVIIVIGGADLRQILIIGLCMLPLLVILAFGRSYRVQRITSFLNPFDDPSEAGYQLVQSLFALAHGGKVGTGLGKSIQKLLFLPEAHTDFIFAVIGEEVGFVGVLLFFLIFSLFIWRGFSVAIKSSDSFGLMLGIGIVTMIFIQFIFNLGAVTGCLPITGVPLPFISYGGSSLILCTASTGILLSISRDNNRRRQGLTKKL